MAAILSIASTFSPIFPTLQLKSSIYLYQTLHTIDTFFYKLRPNVEIGYKPRLPNVSICRERFYSPQCETEESWRWSIL
jgi:hypothetical protein